MGTRDEMSHSRLLTPRFDRLLTSLVLLGEAGSQSFYFPIRLTQDFHSCTMNHVNCPRGITIFAQLLDNFLLLWHFAVFLFKFYLQPALIRLSLTQWGPFLFLFFLFLLFVSFHSLFSPNIQGAISSLGDAGINLKISSDSKCTRRRFPSSEQRTTNLAVAYHLFLLGNITMKDSPH